MEYIKNLSGETLILPPVGISLALDAHREISEFATRSKLQTYAHYFNDLVYEDKVIILSANLEPLTKTESVQYFSNAYSEMVIKEDKSTDNDKFYFVKDSFTVDNNSTIVKTFDGAVDSIFVTSKNNALDVSITTGDGLVLPFEFLHTKQTLELTLNGRLKNPTIAFSAKKGKTTVDCYIDGTSKADVTVLQSFIDNWEE